MNKKKLKIYIKNLKNSSNYLSFLNSSIRYFPNFKIYFVHLKLYSKPYAIIIVIIFHFHFNQKDYCSHVRAQLQANTDSLIAQIETLKIDMTQKINRFENDSIQSFESRPENKFEYSMVCKETEKSIKQFELTGNQVYIIFQLAQLIKCKQFLIKIYKFKSTDANQIIEMLAKERAKLNELAFKKKIFRLESNETASKLNENILGLIVYDMNTNVQK